VAHAFKLFFNAYFIANDPGTSVVYAESLALAEDLVQFAFTGKLMNRHVQE